MSTTLNLGQRIYYLGDMANEESAGTVVAVRPAGQWRGESYDLDLDDGRTLRGIGATNFGASLNYRFWTLEDWLADRQRKIDSMAAEWGVR